MGDPEVVRYLGGTPFSREDTWRRVLCAPGLWALLGFGYWAVERREDGVLIGQVGFADFKRDMEPGIEGLPEMGWIFAPHAHGQGYAGEAVAGCARLGGRSTEGAGDRRDHRSRQCRVDPCRRESRLRRAAGRPLPERADPALPSIDQLLRLKLRHCSAVMHIR